MPDCILHLVGKSQAYFFCRNQFIIFKSDLTGFNPYFVRPGEGDGSTVADGNLSGQNVLHGLEVFAPLAGISWSSIVISRFFILNRRWCSTPSCLNPLWRAVILLRSSFR